MATQPVGPDGGAYDDLSALPDQVRSRVLSLAADVLPQVAGLPPAVRRVPELVVLQRDAGKPGDAGDLLAGNLSQNGSNLLCTWLIKRHSSYVTALR